MSSSVSIQNASGAGIGLHSLAVSAGYIGAALGVAMVIPQIVRTLRDRDAPGVSVSSWALTALSCLTWLLYGIRAGEPPQIPGNVLMVTGAALIVVLVPSVLRVRTRALRLLAPASVLVVLATVAPAAVIGLVAFGIGLVSAVPQLVSCIRGRADQTSGVSVPAWLLRGASQVSWLVYALARHDAVVTISASFILTSSLLLVGCELRRRSTVGLSDHSLDNVGAGI